MFALLIAVVPVSVVAAAPPAAESAERVTLRVAGVDRFETAARIAERSFPSVAATVYLARADVFADALAAGVLTDGPVLLVPPCGGLPDVVVDQIDRLDPDRVLALGGPAAVCDQLLEQAASGRDRGRVAGSNRFETAVQVSRRAFPGPVDEVYLASANDSPDAVAGGTLTSGPILLVPPAGVPPQVVVDEIVRLSPQRVVVLGGTAAVSEDTVAGAAGTIETLRVAGPDRFATAAQIAAHQFGPGSAVAGAATVAYLARGDVFADAVASGALRDGPVLLVPSCGGLPDPVREQLVRLQPSRVLALGGPGAVCDQTLDAAGSVPGLEVIVPDTTVVLDAAGRAALVDDRADGTLVFDTVGAPGVTVGDVLVSHEVPGVARQGLLRQVTSVTRQGDTVLIGTAGASLPDAIHEGTLSLNVPLTRNDLLTEAARTSARQTQATVNLVDFSDSREFLRTDQVVVTGTLAYNASLEVDVDIDAFPLPHVAEFETALSFDEASDLTLVASDQAQWAAGPTEIWEGEFRCFWVQIGPVPVAFCPELEIFLSSEGDVAGEITMAAGQTASGRFGASYADESWSQIRSYTDDHTYQPPSLAVQAAANANVRAQLNIEVYDLAGPYVYGDLYIRGEGELVDTTACWGLYAGIAGGFGGQIGDDVFGDDLQLPELQLLEHELLLAEDPAPHTPCVEPAATWVGTVSVNRDLFWNYGPGNTVHETESGTWTLTPNTTYYPPDTTYGTAPAGDGEYRSMLVQGSGQRYYDQDCDFTEWWDINWPEGEETHLYSGLGFTTGDDAIVRLDTYTTSATTWSWQDCDDPEPISNEGPEGFITGLGSWPHPGYPLVDDDPAVDHLVGTTVLTRSDIEWDDELQEYDVTITYDLWHEAPAS